MRPSTWFLPVLLAGCHPSATVEHTMPVANLQSFHTIGVRVHAANFAAQATFLESTTLQHLHQQCAFQESPQGAPADVVLDLNITNMGRGGDGWMKNPNLATIETLLVLTDKDGELLGTARIHGKSSGMVINNSNPENEAIDVVGKTVADLLATSGCSGPRVARAVLPPPGPGPGPGPKPDPGHGSTPPPPPDESHRAEAEALNDKGKEKLYGDDIPGAMALFQQANSVLPDARYEFNVCLALGAQSQWDNAVAACHQARGMNPQAELAAKIDHRIDLLQHRQ